MRAPVHFLLRSGDVPDDELVGLLEGDIAAAITGLIAFASDDEVAHAAEDNLRERVLRAIALTSGNAAALAKAALATSSVRFSRWCA